MNSEVSGNEVNSGDGLGMLREDTEAEKLTSDLQHDSYSDSLRSALLKAQADFIQAQTVYIHGHDLESLINAQNDLIKAQFELIKVIKVDRVPGVNEQLIRLQIAILKELGEL